MTNMPPPISYYKQMMHHSNGSTTNASSSSSSKRKRCCDSPSVCYCKLLFLGLGWFYGVLLLVAKSWHVTENFSPFAAAALPPNSQPQQQQQRLATAATVGGLRHYALSSRVVVATTTTTKNVNSQQGRLPGGQIPPNNVWDESTLLPQWMKDYFVWHQEQRALITPDNWSNFTYLVMQCASFDRKCGGTADRLKPTPMMILLAYQMKRILFIHWQRPVPLEQFLLPPQGGMDWRMPKFLQPDIGAIHSPIKAIIKMQRMINASNITINVRYQSYTGGATYFDENKPYGPNFTELYRDVWRVMFTPHPTIASMVQDQMTKLGLQPQQYASIHLRAHYRVEKQKRAAKYVELWAPNAVKCASQLLPGGPYFFASDSIDAIRLAQEYGNSQNVRVVARDDVESSKNITSPAEEPLHLDMASHRRRASDYYDTFVDLYLLAMGKCVSFGVGGYGTWALLISVNASCGIKHFNGQAITPCEWQEVPRQKDEEQQQQLSVLLQQQQQQQTSLFLPPMDDDDNDDQDEDMKVSSDADSEFVTAMARRRRLLLDLTAIEADATSSTPHSHNRTHNRTSTSTSHTLPSWVSSVVLWLWKKMHSSG